MEHQPTVSEGSDGISPISDSTAQANPPNVPLPESPPMASLPSGIPVDQLSQDSRQEQQHAEEVEFEEYDLRNNIHLQDIVLHGRGRNYRIDDNQRQVWRLSLIHI